MAEGKKLHDHWEAAAGRRAPSKRDSESEALRARGAELEAVIDGTSFMLARLDRDMRYRFISRAYARMIARRSEDVIGKHVGYMAQEAIGKSITLLMPADLHAEEQQILARIAHGALIEHYETVRRCKDGRPIEVSLTVSPVRNAEGRVVGASKIARDITERRQAEQTRRAAERELRALSERLESEVEKRTLERDRIWNVSEDLLGVSNFAGYFISINPAWTRLLGWSEQEIRSMHVSELRHPDDAAHSTAGLAGWFQITVTAARGHTLDEIRPLVLEILGQVQQQGVSAQEVERAKRNIIANRLRTVERIGGFGGKADLLNAYQVFLGDPGYLPRDIARYRAVTPRSVQAFATKFLVPDERIELDVVPAPKKTASAEGGAR